MCFVASMPQCIQLSFNYSTFNAPIERLHGSTFFLDGMSVCHISLRFHQMPLDRENPGGPKFYSSRALLKRTPYNDKNACFKEVSPPRGCLLRRHTRFSGSLRPYLSEIETLRCDLSEVSNISIVGDFDAGSNHDDYSRSTAGALGDGGNRETSTRPLIIPRTSSPGPS